MHPGHACTSADAKCISAAEQERDSENTEGQAVVSVAETPVEDILNLPAPLCHAWFRHARSVSVRLDSRDLAARSVATGALSSAEALQQLALYASIVAPGQGVGTGERDAPAQREGDLKRERDAVHVKTEAQGKMSNGKKGNGHKRDNRGRRSERTAKQDAGCSATPAAAKQVCTFAVVQQCLMAPKQLRVLHMHGVHLLPHELHSFGAVLRSLAPTLEILTLCQVQPPAAQHGESRSCARRNTVGDNTNAAAGGSNSQRAPGRSLNPHAYAIDEKRLLCNAVAQLGNLVTLSFPELHEFVSRGTDLVRPIACMESLKTVYVNSSSVHSLCRAMPQIDFEPLPRGVCSCSCMHGQPY